MKRHNWLLVLMILVCIGGFFGYRMWDRIRTDTKAPEITVDAQTLEVSVQDPKTALLQGVTATDRVDGDVTASLVVESISLLSGDGTISVSCAAFDAAGNVAKVTREAKYTDYEGPKFQLEAPLLYSYGSNFDILSTIGATDALDGDIQHRVRATSLEETSIAAAGTHFVQFQVTNSLGDTVTQVFPVEVYSADVYDAHLSLKEYLVYLPAGARFDADDYLESFTLAGETVNLGRGLPTNYSLRTVGNVDTQTPGTYTIEYRVTYTDRNVTNSQYDRTYTGYSKLIVVVEG